MKRLVPPPIVSVQARCSSPRAKDRLAAPTCPQLAQEGQLDGALQGEDMGVRADGGLLPDHALDPQWVPVVQYQPPRLYLEENVEETVGVPRAL